MANKVVISPVDIEARKALVKDWQDKILDSRKHHEKVFKRMRKNQDFAMQGADKAWKNSGKYTVPILPRYINQAVSSLYARNPTSTFSRRRRLQYQLFDGRSDTLQAAMQSATMGDPGAMAMLRKCSLCASRISCSIAWERP